MMKLRLLFISIVCFLNPKTPNAQSRWVPLVHQLDTMPEGTKEYAALLVDICWQISEFTPDTAFYYGNKALAYAEQNNADSIYARAFISLSAAESYRGNHAKAVELSIRGLDYAKKIRDTVSIIDGLNNIGIDLYYQKNFPDAIRYYEQLINLAVGINDSVRLGNTYNNIAMIHEELENYDNAIRNYDLAIKIFEKLDDKLWLPNAYNNVGSMYAKKGDYDLSTRYLDKAISGFLQISNPLGLSDSYNKIASSLLKQGKLDAAERNILRSIAMMDTINQNLQLIDSYDLAYEIYKAKNEKENALYYLEKYQSKYEKMRDIEQVEIIQELKEEYESVQKEEEIQRLEKENTISKLNTEQAEQQTLILFLFVGLLTVITIGILIVLKTKNVANKKLNEANETLSSLNHTKDKLFSIISHDLKSPISSFHLITRSLTENWDQLEKDQLKEYIVTLRDSSANVRDMMDNLLKWALSQTNQLKYEPLDIKPTSIVNKVSDQLSSALQLKGIKIRNELDPETQLNADQEYLEIIIRNLLANAIKFSNLSSEIIVKATETENNKVISISDYGVGMNPEQAKMLFDGKLTAHEIQNSSEKGTGLGLNLCNELMKKMGGSIDVESEINKGTTFKLIFPKIAA